MWQLLHTTIHDFKYDDDHPTYKLGMRARHNPHRGINWDLYYDNGTELNDNHVQTALEHIGAEL